MFVGKYSRGGEQSHIYVKFQFSNLVAALYPALPEEQNKLRDYMFNYFSMMMAISSIFLVMDGSEEALQKRSQLWADLKAHDERLYHRCRLSVAELCNLPGKLGGKISLAGYRVAQRIFKFN